MPSSYLNLDIQLQGFDEFISKLNYFANGGLIAPAFKKYAEHARQVAIDGTPVGDPSEDEHSGLMKKSWKQPQYITNRNGMAAIIENTVDYGIAENYGHYQEVGRYVPAIGKRLVHSWVPGTYALEDTMDKAEMAWSSIVRPEIVRTWNENRTKYYDRPFAELKDEE